MVAGSPVITGNPFCRYDRAADRWAWTGTRPRLLDRAAAQGLPAAFAPEAAP